MQQYIINTQVHQIHFETRISRIHCILLDTLNDLSDDRHYFYDLIYLIEFIRYNVTKYYITSYHIIRFYIMRYLTIGYHIIRYHIIRYHIS